MDFKWTEDGDICLSNSKTDEDGNLLYLHEDDSITTEKGFDGKEIKDVETCFGTDIHKTIILNRLKTDNPDWFHHIQMGADLSDLIGEFNTRETGELGAEKIRKALQYGNSFGGLPISVRPIPISPEEIMFSIDIGEEDYRHRRFPVIFNLAHGNLYIYNKGEGTR